MDGQNRTNSLFEELTLGLLPSPSPGRESRQGQRHRQAKPHQPNSSIRMPRSDLPEATRFRAACDGAKRVIREGRSSVAALPHRHGPRPDESARAALSSKSDGRRPHPGARASRPHAIPLRAAQFPRDAAPGHPAGGHGMGPAEAESWRRCRSARMKQMAQAVPRLVRAGRPRSRVDFNP